MYFFFSSPSVPTLHPVFSPEAREELVVITQEANWTISAQFEEASQRGSATLWERLSAYLPELQRNHAARGAFYAGNNSLIQAVAETYSRSIILSRGPDFLVDLGARLGWRIPKETSIWGAITGAATHNWIPVSASDAVGIYGPIIASTIGVAAGLFAGLVAYGVVVTICTLYDYTVGKRLHARRIHQAEEELVHYDKRNEAHRSHRAAAVELRKRNRFVMADSSPGRFIERGVAGVDPSGLYYTKGQIDTIVRASRKLALAKKLLDTQKGLEGSTRETESKIRQLFNRYVALSEDQWNGQAAVGDMHYTDGERISGKKVRRIITLSSKLAHGGRFIGRDRKELHRLLDDLSFHQPPK